MKGVAKVLLLRKFDFWQDLRVMEAWVEIGMWLFPKLEYLSPRQSLAQFGKLMACQLNLELESRHLEHFAINFRKNKQIGRAHV